MDCHFSRNLAWKLLFRCFLHPLALFSGSTDTIPVIFTPCESNLALF